MWWRKRKLFRSKNDHLIFIVTIELVEPAYVLVGGSNEVTETFFPYRKLVR